MNRWCQAVFAVTLSGVALASGSASAEQGNARYVVTVTNITKGQIFTPVIVSTHRWGVKLFTLGEPAKEALEKLAEGGDTVPLAAYLKRRGARDVATATGVLPPGESVTLRVRTDERHAWFSVAAMLIPSNDAFMAVNGMRGPEGRGRRSILSPAYDAGTEANDELCVSIPGPPDVCAGEGYNPNAGEGYVYVHAGIQGVGDLRPGKYDWRNPVARITVRRVER